MKESDVLMIGAFPPPVHGMAAINKAMSEKLIARHVSVGIINISASSLSRGAGYHLTRAGRCVRGLFRLLRHGGGETRHAYMSISGGWGQLYEIPFVLLLAARRLRLTFHHHSYANLTRPSPLLRLLIKMAPRDTLHIVLSPGMGRELKRIYGVSRILVLSNAAFMPDMKPVDIPERPFKSVGFLGNISEEKGILEFISLLDRCIGAGLQLDGVIAGPFQDEAARSGVMALVDERPYLRYVGPQYGEAKVAFFDSIDALIFPTKYANEAEPVTIHEALMRGVPVIAYGRGAIPEILEGPQGAVIPPEDEFAPDAARAIADWMKMGAGFREIRLLAFEHSKSIQSRASQSLQRWIDSIKEKSDRERRHPTHLTGSPYDAA